MWKLLSAILLIALILSNVFHIYLHLDHGVTQTYQSQSFSDLKSTLQSYDKICDVVVRGKTEGELMKWAQRLSLDKEAFVKEGALHLQGLSIRLDADKKALECFHTEY